MLDIHKSSSPVALVQPVCVANRPCGAVRRLADVGAPAASVVSLRGAATARRPADPLRAASCAAPSPVHQAPVVHSAPRASAAAPPRLPASPPPSCGHPAALSCASYCVLQRNFGGVCARRAVISSPCNQRRRVQRRVERDTRQVSCTLSVRRLLIRLFCVYIVIYMQCWYGSIKVS